MRGLAFLLLGVGAGYGRCYAQDSLVYSTRNPIIVEYYHFYWSDGHGTNGTFRYEIDLDGNQLLRGTGSFTRRQNRIFMSPFRQVRYQLDWNRVRLNQPNPYQARDTVLVPAEEARVTPKKLIPRCKVPGRPPFYQDWPSTRPAAAR